MVAGFRDECPDSERDGGSPRPHAQVRAFLASMPPPLSPWSAGIEAVRADVRERVLAVTGELEPVASVEAIEANGVPGRLYRPSEASEAVLIWAHGGGWMHGDLDSCEGVARALANRARCAVVAVDYRLAPEHPFPAGFDDVWPAIEWAKRTFAGSPSAGTAPAGTWPQRLRSRHVTAASARRSAAGLPGTGQHPGRATTSSASDAVRGLRRPGGITGR